LAKTLDVEMDSNKTHIDALEKFFQAMPEIHDEPLDEEFDAILAKRVNINRELDL
jgi:hypothetical protein